jgi:trk system potassium uptake protein TrkA
VVIVGGGNVGLAVATALESARRPDPRQGDREEPRLRRTRRRCAGAHDRAAWRRAGIRAAGRGGIDRADAVLAVTDDDKTNMLAAVRAKARAAGWPSR